MVMTDMWAITHKAEFHICQPLRCFALQMSQKFYIKLLNRVAQNSELKNWLPFNSYVGIWIGHIRKLNWNLH